MKNKLVVEDQVVFFLQRQPPETRRRMREALHAVENGEIFPEPLEDELDGFYKLKVDCIRIILMMESAAEGPVMKAVFAERRRVVYELFSQILGLE
jgi:mRNA-degrading endonuclease RelE of RelBE toxin-antitoxin system